MHKKSILYILFSILSFSTLYAQEDSPFVAYDVPAQNLLKFNRFLINPTFSTVREDKSYVSLLHRNQSVQFNDNNQNYFLSYSGRIGDRAGVGLSLYSQRLGTLSNYGPLANYAYGIKINEQTNFTFGANVSYYRSGFDVARANTVEDDPYLAGLQDQNLLSFQPGINISYNNFDVGLFAENLFDYNLKTNASVTEFTDKTFSGHLQYTHQFKNDAGLFEGGRLMPLVRTRKIGEEELTYGGSLIVDLPKLGWLQAGYDSFYGAAAGIGFNLSDRISLGYTLEKGLSSNFDAFGATHEISVAYSFTPKLTEDRVMLEEDMEDLAENSSEEKLEQQSTNEELIELRRKLAENDEVLQELIFRQDSLETHRKRDLERRFNMVMRMVRNETKGSNPALEEKAEDLFMKDVRGTAELAEVNTTKKSEPTSRMVAVANAVGAVPTRNRVNNDRVIHHTLKNTVKNTVAPAVNKPNTKFFKEKSATTQDNITNKRFRNLPDVTNGYYVVANVYKRGRYMDNFINTLNGKGFDASYVDNTNNGLKYVYLDRFETLAEAKKSAKNNFDGKYKGAMWIMNVDNSYTNNAYAANVKKLKTKSLKYNSNEPTNSVVAQDELTSKEKEENTFSNGNTNYYLIANVFSKTENANKFVALLNSYGLSASYFINPKNNYRYVYLKKHDSWNNALISYYTKLNDAYDEKMWIMRVSTDLVT